MKLKQNSESTNKQQSSIARAIICLAVGLFAAVQMGCSSTGSAATQQVFQPQTQAPGFYANPAWGGQQQFQAPFNQVNPAGGSSTSFQGPTFQGGSGTSFQGNPYGGGSGTTFQADPSGPYGFNGRGSCTNFQSNSGSGTRSQFGSTFPNYQQSRYFQSGYSPPSSFNPFGLAKTSC